MICAPAPLGRQMTMQHLLGQSMFEIAADEAWGETFFVMHAVIAGQTASGFGRYVDYFQRIQDAWKLVYRRVVPDATIPGDDPRYDWLTASPHS